MDSTRRHPPSVGQDQRPTLDQQSSRPTWINNLPPSNSSSGQGTGTAPGVTGTGQKAKKPRSTPNRRDPEATPWAWPLRTTPATLATGSKGIRPQAGSTKGGWGELGRGDTHRLTNRLWTTRGRVPGPRSPIRPLDPGRSAHKKALKPVVPRCRTGCGNPWIQGVHSLWRATEQPVDRLWIAGG